MCMQASAQECWPKHCWQGVWAVRHFCYLYFAYAHFLKECMWIIDMSQMPRTALEGHPRLEKAADVHTTYPYQGIFSKDQGWGDAPGQGSGSGSTPVHTGSWRMV